MNKDFQKVLITFISHNMYIYIANKKCNVINLINDIIGFAIMVIIYLVSTK